MAKVSTADKKRAAASTKKANELPTWDLFKHGVSPSGIKTWLKNREEFRLVYCENWASKYSKPYNDFGNAVHAVFEAAAANPTKKPGFDLIKSEIEKWEIEEKKRGTVWIGADRIQELEMTLGKAEVLCAQYFERWHAEDKSHNVFGAEMVFRLPFDVDGVNIFLNGTWDRVFETGKDLVIRDTKTKSQINEGNITDTFVHDIQFNLYLLAYLKENGRLPAVQIDVIRNPSSKVTKADGSLGVYLSRLTNEVKKDPDHYFMRFTAHFTKSEVLKWAENQLKPILRDMIRWYHAENLRNYLPGGKEPNSTHYFNPDGLIVNHVRSDFFDAIVNNDYSGLRKGAHWQKYLKR